MKPLEEILQKINDSVERYESQKLGLVHDQSEILRNLSTNLYFLTEHRIHYNKEWLSVYFQSKGTSDAARQREADFAVQHLYKIRHLMRSAEKVLDSLRSTISTNKQ